MQYKAIYIMDKEAKEIFVVIKMHEYDSTKEYTYYSEGLQEICCVKIYEGEVDNELARKIARKECLDELKKIRS
ncbi:MAG: hypothetical protein ACRCWM_08680, partial [Sarcina sp.]